MGAYFGISDVVATPTLDRVGREERLQRDMPQRQRFAKHRPANRKPPSRPSEDADASTASGEPDEVDAVRRRFDVTA
ncbi:MAG: hypothetical protein LBT74_00035 [Acidobacteriota bacterium]|jgi:hypothetical protein|nr:hypothetical protein [Acidobacteriota bacterium]